MGAVGPQSSTTKYLQSLGIMLSKAKILYLLIEILNKMVSSHVMTLSIWDILTKAVPSHTIISAASCGSGGTLVPLI